MKNSLKYSKLFLLPLAFTIASSCNGVKTISLHIPYKKYHPNATIKKDNILNMFTLTKAFLEKINNFNFSS